MTPHQLETLRVISSGVVTKRKFGYGSWRIDGGQVNPSTVGRLITAGLVKWSPSEDGQTAEITEAGSAALSESQKGMKEKKGDNLR